LRRHSRAAFAFEHDQPGQIGVCNRRDALRHLSFGDRRFLEADGGSGNVMVVDGADRASISGACGANDA